MGTIFNPLIQNTNQSYQKLVTQMNWIANFFGTPLVQIRPIVQLQLARPIQNEGVVLEENTVNPGKQFVPHVVGQKRPNTHQFW